MEELAMRYFRVGELLFYMAQYPDSLTFTEKSRSLSEKINYGNTSVHAYAVNLLARLYERSDDNEKALAFYTQALFIRKRTKGCPKLLVAYSLNNLAGFHLKHGKRHWESLPLYKEALQIVKGLYGPIHIEVADLTLSLGQVHYEMGKLDEALALYEQSLEMRLKLQGENHAKTAICYSNMANIHKRREAYEEAIDLYEKAVRITREVHGGTHPTYASELVNLANALVCGRGDRAVEQYYELYQEAYGIRQVVFGEEHALTKEVLNLMQDHESAYQDAMESGPAIVHRKCFF
eukprot:TRINITY_DN2459_c0_g1_i1.p1 TRINITY_DN2459_c0_g1~~TRINITY_DN2459_c0_g1_i1.p1  ORF type:complete len:292 (-),score=61.35 TRINITY_DN2459_c0_g1_i1:56-931(-)